MLIVAQVIGACIAIAVASYLAAVAFGLYLVKKGQRPFDADALAAQGGKYVTNSDGRSNTQPLYTFSFFYKL